VFDGSQLGDQLSGDFAIASLVDLLAGLLLPSSPPLRVATHNATCASIAGRRTSKMAGSFGQL